MERTRSRSLSVSLAQERERERERSVGLGAAKKRVLNREVSMSRVFKPKPKVPKAPEAKVTGKRKRPEDDNPTLKVKDEGVTLVVDTTVKPRAGVKTKPALHLQTMRGSQRTVGTTGSFSLLPIGRVIQDDADSEEEWHLRSSPDILLLGGKDDTDGRGSSEGLGLSDGEDDPSSVTPSKSKRPQVQ